MNLTPEAAILVYMELKIMIAQRKRVNETVRKNYGERITPGPDQECKRRDAEIDAFQQVIDQLPMATV